MMELLNRTNNPDYATVLENQSKENLMENQKAVMESPQEYNVPIPDTSYGSGYDSGYSAPTSDDSPSYDSSGGSDSTPSDY